MFNKTNHSTVSETGMKKVIPKNENNILFKLEEIRSLTGWDKRKNAYLLFLKLVSSILFKNITSKFTQMMWMI